MIEKALEKIKNEMNSNKNNSYVQVVGNYLLGILQDNPGAAEKILVNGKTVTNRTKQSC